MNYTKHYNRLIERAKNRRLDEYKERHHIIPRCIGGGDNKENIVELTPEEHYVAHQLLLKMYPNKPGLIYAAMMMTVKSNNQTRNNKLYGWLKRKYANTCSKNQQGKGNTQYGTCWVSNLKTRECKRIKVDELDIYLSAGWIKKRIMNWNNVKSCPNCGITFLFLKKSQRFCSRRCGKTLIVNRGKWLIKERLLEFVNGDWKSLNEYSKHIGMSHKSILSLLHKYYPKVKLSRVDLTGNKEKILIELSKDN